VRAGRAVALAFAGLATVGSGARAQLAASMAVDSDYRFRGVSLSGGEPTARATVDYDAASGGYGGASLTGVELIPGEHEAQLLAYAGVVGRLDAHRRFELGASYAHFSGDSSYDYGEVYAGLLADRWSARLYYAPDYFGRSARTLYAELNAHHPLGERARLFGHIGALVPLSHRDDADAGRTRADLRLGAGATFGDLDLQLSWVAVSRAGPYPAVYAGQRQRLVFGAVYSF
jgi:uncharacterized protein (TIGR02001 family)